MFGITAFKICLGGPKALDFSLSFTNSSKTNLSQIHKYDKCFPQCSQFQVLKSVKLQVVEFGKTFLDELLTLGQKAVYTICVSS